MRPGFLSITAVGCLLGFATAAACGCGFDIPKALLTCALALMAHAGANVLNDCEDTRNGTDQANDAAIRPFTGGSRLIVEGAVSMNEARTFALLLFGIAGLGGVWLALHSGPGLLGIGIVGLLLGWAYSCPPLRLMSRSMGELAVAACWWLIVIGADYAQRGQFFIVPAVVGVSFGLLIANILLINGVPDAPSDAATGKRTLATKLSGPALATTYTAVVLAAHGWVAAGIWLQLHPTLAWVSLASIVPALSAAHLLWQYTHQSQIRKLRTAITLTIITANLHGLLLALGIALTRWIHT